MELDNYLFFPSVLHEKPRRDLESFLSLSRVINDPGDFLQLSVCSMWDQVARVCKNRSVFGLFLRQRVQGSGFQPVYVALVQPTCAQPWH